VIIKANIYLTKEHKPNTALENWIYTIKERGCSKAKKKIKTPALCGLPAQGPKSENTKPKRMCLSGQTTQGLEWSIGKRDYGWDNFRIPKSKLNFCYLPKGDPKQQWAQTWGEIGGGEKREGGNTCAAEHRKGASWGIGEWAAQSYCLASSNYKAPHNSFPQPPVSSSLSGSNVSLCTFFSYIVLSLMRETKFHIHTRQVKL
jgi:hypothetical protein